MMTSPSMQGGGGGSAAAVGAGADEGAAEGAADPAPSIVSVDDVAPAGDASATGAGDEGGGVAGGGVPPPHAPMSEAVAIDSPRRHGSVQTQNDQERMRLSLVQNGASASGRRGPWRSIFPMCLITRSHFSAV